MGPIKFQIATQLYIYRFLCILIRCDLILGLALFSVFFKNISKICPSRLGDQNRVPEISFDFGNGDVTTLSILFTSEKEVLIFNPEMSRLRCRCCFFNLSVVILLNKFFQVMVEFLHSIGWDEDLEPGISSGESFRNFQKSTTCIFLRI